MHAHAAVVLVSGGALGTALAPGAIDVEGDGTADLTFVSLGADSNFLDARTGFGLVGNIGGAPGDGAAWVRAKDARVTADGTGRNEIIDSFRGALWPSEDNWSKVRLSSGNGWVQWRIGATRNIFTPVVFVREGVAENLSAMQAHDLVYGADVLVSGGALGTVLAPGAIDVEGDGTADLTFVSLGADSNFLDARTGLGLVGNIGGAPGDGAAWVRAVDARVTADGEGRNEIIDTFRGALWPSEDNWSKVRLSSGNGWVQWRIGATRNILTPVAFVRERVGLNLSAKQARDLVYGLVGLRSGGALGTALAPGAIDVEGDGTADLTFVSLGADSNFLDARTGFGLVGNIGAAPGDGAAWVRATDARVTADGTGRNEIIDTFRGALWPSEDNWSKVRLSSGNGWVQWRIGATRNIVTPLVFVREGPLRDSSAVDAQRAAEVVFADGFE
jgi:hypothetical protein